MTVSTLRERGKRTRRRKKRRRTRRRKKRNVRGGEEVKTMPETVAPKKYTSESG